MTTTDGTWTFNLIKALKEWERTHPDREERIDFLHGELRRLMKRERRGYGPYPETIPELEMLLRALGEEV